jgi:hypothetical protein
MLVDRDLLKAYVRDKKVVVDVEFVELAATSASEYFADVTGRSWEIAPASTYQVRSFVPRGLSRVLQINDCVDITTVTCNGSTLTGTSWQAEPIGNLSRAGMSWPYEQIRLLSSTTFWPTNEGAATVTVRARWGWPTAIPTRVSQSALMIAQDILAFRDVATGIQAAMGNAFVADTIGRYSRETSIA